MHSLLRTFDPRRLFGDEGVADVLRDARVGAAGEDPGAGGLGGLQQPLPKAPVNQNSCQSYSKSKARCKRD